MAVSRTPAHAPAARPRIGRRAAAGGIARPYLSRAADRPLHHPRHPVRRRLGRLRRGLGAHRPAGAHAGRGRDHRQLHRHPQRGCDRRAAGERFHRQGAARGSAGRPGHFLSHPLRGSVHRRPSWASRRSAISAPRRATARSVSFVWSGDTAGQGWGIDEARGGMRTYATMLRNRPDFFIHSGDSIYADCPIPRGAEAAERRDLAQPRHRGEIAGRRRRSPSFAATTNTICSTPTCARFNAEVPIFAQWDDHEVTNDWWPGQIAPPTTPTRNALAAGGARRAAPSANSCRCGRRWRRPAASIARSPTARCSTCSCSTCAATAGRTATARRRRYGPARQLLGPAQTRLAQARADGARARPGR